MPDGEMMKLVPASMKEEALSSSSVSVLKISSVLIRSSRVMSSSTSKPQKYHLSLPEHRHQHSRKMT